MSSLDITLQFSGKMTEEHAINLYDVGQALIGFERSLALTTHLVLNNEIITQAPALKNAQIVAYPSREGSWELTAGILLLAAGGIYKLGTAPKDTPIGHVIRSAYDYVISNTLGFHVDFDKTLGQQIQESRAQDRSIPLLPQSRFDSLVEKCDVAVREMHRPIYKSETAGEAHLLTRLGSKIESLGPTLTMETYEYIAYTETSSTTTELTGQVSSYNSNTFKGRIYVEEFGRPIPFELVDKARDPKTISTITRSLDANAQRRNDGYIEFVALQIHSRSGRLKALLILEVLSDLHPLIQI